MCFLLYFLLIFKWILLKYICLWFFMLYLEYIGSLFLNFCLLTQVHQQLLLAFYLFFFCCELNIRAILKDFFSLFFFTGWALYRKVLIRELIKKFFCILLCDIFLLIKLNLFLNIDRFFLNYWLLFNYFSIFLLL